jgi:hypothetical protein
VRLLDNNCVTRIQQKRFHVLVLAELGDVAFGNDLSGTLAPSVNVEVCNYSPKRNIRSYCLRGSEE